MKHLVGIGSAKKDPDEMPENIKDVFGYGLHLA